MSNFLFSLVRNESVQLYTSYLIKSFLPNPTLSFLLYLFFPLFFFPRLFHPLLSRSIPSFLLFLLYYLHFPGILWLCICFLSSPHHLPSLPFTHTPLPSHPRHSSLIFLLHRPPFPFSIDLHLVTSMYKHTKKKTKKKKRNENSNANLL